MAIGSIPGDLLAACSIDPAVDAFSGPTLNVGALTVLTPGQQWQLTTFNAGIADSPDVIPVVSQSATGGAGFRDACAFTSGSSTWIVSSVDATGALANGTDLVRFALFRAGK